MQSLLLRRVAAYFLDIVFLFTVLAPLGYLVQQALGLRPASAQEIYVILIVNFSLPVWAYFAFSDQSRKGATLGKRALAIHTKANENERVGVGQAIGRTAVKMLPWELSHASAFLFASAPGTFGLGNWIGIGLSYVLSFAYLLVAWHTRGRRSVHDLVAATGVHHVIGSRDDTTPNEV